MDAMIGPVIFLVIACVIAGPILALVALTRIRRLAGSRDQSEDIGDRLDAVEARIDVLSRRTATLERSATGAATAGARPSPAPESPTQPVKRPEPGVAPGAAPPQSVAPGAVPPSTARPPSMAPPLGPPPFEPPPRVIAPPVARRDDTAPEAEAPLFTPPGPPRPPAAPIDWERWIGIRGAAVVGAVALGLAGLLFFKYSIEQGLITPVMRVVFGTFTGLGCLVGSEWLRTRGYRQTAEGISGAGS